MISLLLTIVNVMTGKVPNITHDDTVPKRENIVFKSSS